MGLHLLHLLLSKAPTLSCFGSTLPTSCLHPCAGPTDVNRAQNLSLGTVALHFHATAVLRHPSLVPRLSLRSRCPPAILLSLKCLSSVASSNNPALTMYSPPLLKLTHVVRSCSSATSSFLSEFVGFRLRLCHLPSLLLGQYPDSRSPD